jgi:chromosome segregation ATPase
MVERRLKQGTLRLRNLRDELRVIDEQLAQLADEADDMGVRSLVSENPGAATEHRHARAHVEAMARHRAHVLDSIAELERRQDQLLDRLTG